MSKITIELAPQQIKEAFEKLPIKAKLKLVEELSIQDKIKLLRRLENETWANRLDEIVSKIRKRFKENPISNKGIRRICEETRQKLYNERNKNEPTN